LQKPKGFIEVKQSYEALKETLKIQPVNVSFAVGRDFMFYNGAGIYSGADCASELNHSMLAVGYGVWAGVEYISVMNSWGEDWAYEGFAFIEFKQEGHGVCQIYADNIVPVLTH